MTDLLIFFAGLILGGFTTAWLLAIATVIKAGEK